MVGRYRLHFYLMKLDSALLQLAGTTSVILQVQSDVFEVFSAKDFPGMRASTPLTRHLKNHGANVSVKKGNENRGRGSQGQSDSGEEKKPGDRDEGGGVAGTIGGLAEAHVEGSREDIPDH